MVCLGLEPRVAGWKAQTNPLSYGGTLLIEKTERKKIETGNGWLKKFSILHLVSWNKLHKSFEN